MTSVIRWSLCRESQQMLMASRHEMANLLFLLLPILSREVIEPVCEGKENDHDGHTHESASKIGSSTDGERRGEEDIPPSEDLVQEVQRKSDLERCLKDCSLLVDATESGEQNKTPTDKPQERARVSHSLQVRRDQVVDRRHVLIGLLESSLLRLWRTRHQGKNLPERCRDELCNRHGLPRPRLSRGLRLGTFGAHPQRVVVHELRQDGLRSHHDCGLPRYRRAYQPRLILTHEG